MIPLRDDVPGRNVPIVTATLIAVNALAFLFQGTLALNLDPAAAQAARELVLELGAVPCRLTGACRGAVDFPDPLATVFTSMFLHVGILHLLGDLLYLWIFGDSAEDALGHGRFVLLYATAGLTAVLVEVLVSPDSAVPLVGASGAVSGVLAAYLCLFPHARISTLVVIGFTARIVRVPGAMVLGLWVAIQVLNAAMTGGPATGEPRGVAWFAHLGALLAGVAVLLALRPRVLARSRVAL
jgi:membrane associated rhomboid family serine protease